MLIFQLLFITLKTAGGSGGATLRPALQHRSDEDDDSQNEEAGDVSGGRRR